MDNKDLGRIATIITIAALLLTSLNTYIFATLDSRLTVKFDERYMERREIERLIQDRDMWRRQIEQRLVRIENKIDSVLERK